MATKSTLSPQEKAVIAHVCEGFTASQTAVLMNIRPETVKSYLKRIRWHYTQHGRPAHNAALLMRRAIEDGVIEPIQPLGGARVDS